MLAKESIYIHDWWLSPGQLPSSDTSRRCANSRRIELLMRRPNKDHYSLERLLDRKAEEGVKIYVIL